jgi:phosphoglycerate dehydrogenase-like enzyme
MTPTGGGPVLVLSEPTGMDADALAVLHSVADVRERECSTRDDLLAAVVDAEILWVRLRHLVDDEVLHAAPRLALIATPTTGVTHLDEAAIAARGIELRTLRGERELLDRIPATAEHTVLLLLALLRGLVPAAEHAAAAGRDRDAFRGREVAGSTVGLIGYGRLGRLVATRLRAFGATLLATDPAVAVTDEDVEQVDLPSLLARSDAVLVLASLEPGSEGLLDAAALARCRPGAVLVNTARGEIVDEQALVAALRDGRLAGAAVDVVADEHRLTADRPLLALARERPDLVLVTPHIGGATVESMAATERHLAEAVRAWIAERPDGSAR